MSYERDEAMRQQEATEAMIRMREPRQSSPHPDPIGGALTRMWVNQPSTLQPLHALNGTNVLAAPDGERLFRVWFLSGDVISQQMPREALSPGWRS